MAPLEPWNTPRVFYHYANSVGSHTLTVRLEDPDGVLADADTLVDAVLTDLSPALYATQILSVEQSASGSNLRFPAASSIVGNSYGSGSATVEGDATPLNFVGKSTGGRLVRFGVFGYAGSFSQFRLTSGENGAIAAAVAELNAAEGAGAAIDGLHAIWKEYANVKPNDHWVKEARN